MPAAVNIIPAKRDDARRLAAHGYRHGAVEDHVDRTRSHLNRVLVGPATFGGARAAINGIRQYQPTGEFDGQGRERRGRKVRSDANVVAQAIFTLPEELGMDQLDEWAATTLAWVQEQTPGRLAWAVLHMDETTPHLHAAIVAEEESGKINYQTTWGGPKSESAPRMRALQASYSEALAPLGVVPNPTPRTYTDTGPDSWRVLKAATEARERAEAEMAASADYQAGLAGQAEDLVPADRPAPPDPWEEQARANAAEARTREAEEEAAKEREARVRAQQAAATAQQQACLDRDRAAVAEDLLGGELLELASQITDREALADVLGRAKAWIMDKLKALVGLQNTPKSDDSVDLGDFEGENPAPRP